jgi:hypothetical protein
MVSGGWGGLQPWKGVVVKPRVSVPANPGAFFRRVYATVLEEWLKLPAKAALAGTFEHLPLFATATP